MPDLAELTDRQIFDLYYHPRDREGKVITSHINQLPGEDEPLTVEQAARIHFGVGAGLGIPREKLEAAWLEKHAEIPEGV